MSRTVSITLSMPHSNLSVTRTITAHGRKPMARRMADAVESFARSRGVSWKAVEYAISLGV